jgi:hypothetical protein
MEGVSYLVSQWPLRLWRGLRPLTYWDFGFEFQRIHGLVSMLSVVCCQEEVSATGRSLVQRSLAECVASECDRDA